MIAYKSIIRNHKNMRSCLLEWRWCLWLNFVRASGCHSVNGAVGNLSRYDECVYLWLICLLLYILAPFRVMYHGPSQHLVLEYSPMKWMTSKNDQTSNPPFWGLSQSNGSQPRPLHHIVRTVFHQALLPFQIPPQIAGWQSILSGCQLPPNAEILLLELTGEHEILATSW